MQAVMATIKNCFLLHNWTKWSKVTTEKAAKNMLYDGRQSYQERHCKNCEVVQRRYL